MVDNQVDSDSGGSIAMSEPNKIQQAAADLRARIPAKSEPAKKPDAHEIAGPLCDRILQCRSDGAQAVANECRRLRAEANGPLGLQAVNIAIERAQLTDEERAALDGPKGGGTGSPQAQSAPAQEAAPAPSGTQAPGNSPPPASGAPAAQGHETPQAQTTPHDGAKPQGPPPTEQAQSGAPKHPESGAGAPPAGEGGAHRENKPNAQPGTHGPGGAQPAGGHGPAHGGGPGGAAGGHEGGTQHAASTPHSGESGGDVSGADGRAVIEDELAQHERWKVLSSNNRGARAAMLLDGVLRNDLLIGAEGAATQVGLGLVVQTAARRIPVPGLGNMVGGFMSAQYLFSQGGFKALTNEMGHGVHAVSDLVHGHVSFQTVADLLAGIKALLEMIGHIANVVSGVCYGLAAIAAIGTLLSIVFPPLAVCASAIPVLMDFGQAAGAVGTIVLAVANILSIFPPIFRAIHLIVSNDDPFRLMAQEKLFHEETQNALANYGAMGANKMISGHGPLHEIQEASHNLGNSFRGGGSPGGAHATNSEHAPPSGEHAPAGGHGEHAPAAAESGHGSAAGGEHGGSGGHEGGGHHGEPPLGSHADRVQSVGAEPFRQDQANAGGMRERAGNAREFIRSYFSGEGYGNSGNVADREGHRQQQREAQQEQSQAERETQQAQREVEAAQAERDAAMTDAIRGGDKRQVAEAGIDPERGPTREQAQKLAESDPSRVGDVEGAQARRDAALLNQENAQRRREALAAEGDPLGNQSNASRLQQKRAKLREAEARQAQAERELLAAQRNLAEAQAKQEKAITDEVRGVNRQPIADPEHGPNAQEIADRAARDPSQEVAAAHKHLQEAERNLASTKAATERFRRRIEEGESAEEHAHHALNAGTGQGGSPGDAGWVWLIQWQRNRHEEHETHKKKELDHVAQQVRGQQGGGHAGHGNGEAGHGNAAGHENATGGHGGAQKRVVLPEPPTRRLPDVDTLDREIQVLSQQLPQQRNLTRQARTVEQDAQAGARVLQNMQQGVNQRTAQHSAQGQAEQQRIGAQNQQAQAQSTQAQSQSGGQVGQASSQLAPIAGVARTADDLAQKFPDNRWVDASSLKTNIHGFRTGIDQAMCIDPEYSGKSSQVSSLIDGRNQTLMQAGQTRAVGTAAAGQLVGRIQNDQTASLTAAQTAQAAGKQSRAQEQTLEQRLAQKRREREQVWSDLLNWAANHRQVRTAAQAAATQKH